MKKYSLTKFILLQMLITLTFLGCKKDNNDPAVAEFEVSALAVNVNEPVDFINNSSHAESFVWHFGDGLVSTAENPSHTYSYGAVYEVRLAAKGKENSDTASTLITVQVDTTIRAGYGILEIGLGNSLNNVLSNFSTDTLYFRDYSAEYGIYAHTVAYIDQGLAFVFYSTESSPSSFDPVYMIYVFHPYFGSTEKGITIGNPIKPALEIYGEPEEKNEYSNAVSYSYLSQGIDLVEIQNSGFVEEIDIYPPTKDYAAMQSHPGIRSAIQKYSIESRIAIRRKLTTKFEVAQ